MLVLVGHDLEPRVGGGRVWVGHVVYLCLHFLAIDCHDLLKICALCVQQVTRFLL
jgi:hypothetical protein